MKTIAVHLRPETASHRKRLLGIFKHFGSSDKWEIRLVHGEDDLCSLLLSNNGAEAPDGIISGVPYTSSAKAAIASSGVPFVGIGAFDGDLESNSSRIGFVMNDNAGIGKAAAEYLHSLGDFRSYAYVPDVRQRAWSALRGDAFRSALEKHGRACETFASRSAGDGARLSEFLARLPKPAAVFAAWDGRGADVILAAHKAKLRIPFDISVLGVDDDELICEHTVPQLSSVKTDAEGMGEAAARMISRMVSGGQHGRVPTVVCPVLGIAERQSTRTPPPTTSLIKRALAFIDAEATKGIVADDVAHHLGVSRRLLDLRFSQYESQSLSKRILERKIEETKRLLAGSSISVKDAFRKSGFGNIAYATSLFKSTIGMTPEAWRRAHTGKSDKAACEGPFSRLEELSEADSQRLRELSLQLSPDARLDHRSLEKSIRQGLTLLFVLRRRSRIVASATAVRYSTPTGEHCRIEDVVVDERLRGKGLGRKIMQETLAALRAMNVSRIELTSHPSRVAARALYRSLGFKPRKTGVFELRLADL